MNCRKCSRPLPDGALFCPWCGAKQEAPRRGTYRRMRGNGAGTAYKRGRSWYCQVTVGCTPTEGGVRFNRVAKGGFATKREALAYCPILREEATARKPERRRLTFAEIYDAWYDQHVQHVGSSTMGCYSAARKYFSALDGFYFDEIDLDDLQECVDECPCGRRTLENMKALAGLLCKYALPRHQTDMNYAEFIHIGHDEKKARPAFSFDQVEAIRALVGKTPYADYVYALIYTGFRPTELLSLRKEDLSDGILYGGSKTAAGRNRAVPVPPQLHDIIQQRLAFDSPWLFPRADGQRMNAKYFRETFFYPVLAAAGIQKIPTPDRPAYYVPYSCRHTFSNLLKNASGSDKDKAALMGHTDYRTTKRMYQSAELASLRLIMGDLNLSHL